MTTLETVLLAFGGNVALLAVLGWLARSLLGQLFAKDLERFKSDLANVSTVATERLKHELQLVAQERHVQVAKLHERRAEVVAEAYGLLVEVQWAMLNFVDPIEGSGEPSKFQRFSASGVKSAEFCRYFDKHRIYLPAALCDQIDAFVSAMRQNVRGFGLSVRLEHEGEEPNESMDSKSVAWGKARSYFESEVPKARAALEAELRSIIGSTR